MNRFLLGAAPIALGLALSPLPAMAACQTLATIESPGLVPLQQNVMVAVPPSGGVTVAGYGFINLAAQLTTAQKEATGNTLYLEADTSADNGVTWQFVSSTSWSSYGQQVTVKLPGNCILTDPDPFLGVPISSQSNLYRIQYMTNLTTATPVFSGK